MAEKKSDGFWDRIGRSDPKAALQGLLDTVTDLTPWSADSSKAPKQGIKPPNPTARRIKAAPRLGVGDAVATTAINLIDPRQWFSTFKDTVTAIPSLLSGEVVNSIGSAWTGQQIAERRAKKLDVSPNWYRNNILLPRERKRYSDKQISDLMRGDTARWNVLANEFSYVVPETKQRVFDWNAVGHRLVENPADVVLMFTGIGEVGAAGNLARLTKLGRIGPDADIISNAGNLSRKVQTVSRAGSIAADPLTALAVTGGTKALVRGASIANRTISNPVTSILDPDYVTAFEAYKDRIFDNLVNSDTLDERLSPKEAKQWINQNKDNMFYSFNAENGGRFSNPYNTETTALFAAQGKDPTAYGAPSIYNRVNQKFNRTGGPSEASLRQVTLEAAQVPSPRRSATTLEAAPSGLNQNNKNWVANQQQNLATQLDDRMSANYPGQQFDFASMTRPTNPVAGSTIGDFVYRPDGGWHSTSGNRAGPSLQPVLNEQFRMQNPNPNISPADLDFVRRNRAASSDLGQAYSTNPPSQTVGERFYNTGKTVLRPLTAGIGTFMYTGSPQFAAAAGVGAAGQDIYRGLKTGKNYLDEVSGAPFNYNPSNPLLRNNALIPRTAAQVASAVVPNPIQLPPAEQKPAPSAPILPAAAVAADREAVKMPEVKQEYTQDVTMPSGDLAPEKYDLSGFGSGQGELKPEVYDLSQFDAPQRMYGGRAAYKAGGKVGGIEPLIQALMNKAKTAKKVSNKATEPLLNERDDAIASALAVAQKAI